MFRKLGRRAAVGFAATALVQMVIMLIMAQAGNSLVTLEFSLRFTNETAAVVAQLMLVSLIGMTFACGAQIFEIERWSFLLQGVVHFAVTAAVWMPVAWICWRPISVKASLLSALGWLLTYAVIWFVQYLIYRNSIRRLNASISSFAEVNEDEG